MGSIGGWPLLIIFKVGTDVSVCVVGIVSTISPQSLHRLMLRTSKCAYMEQHEKLRDE